MNNNYLKYLGFLLILLISCKSQEAIPTENILPQLHSDVSFLADDKLEGRRVGTEGEIKAANYIAERYKAIGLIPKGTNGYFQEFSTRKKSNPHETKAKETDPLITGRNVVGFIDHGAPTSIVIGAHFDHLGWGGSGSLNPSERAIHNGADDNASGVAALLALAKKLKKGPKNNNYIFIAFSGEEEGLWGSNHFAKNPTINLEKVNYMLNMDMVGRLNAERQLAVYGVGTSPLWRENVMAISEPQFKFSFTESGIGPSDHTSFYLKDIPVLHFFTGQHKDYHKPSDDVEFVNFDGIQDVVRLINRLILRLDDDNKIAFTKTKEEKSNTPRFKVTLGVIPDYLFDGKGMRIDGVTEGRPAQIADIQDGDIVVKMGDVDVIDMMSYMQALSKFEAGQTVIVVVKRGDNLLEKSVTFD
jgi:Zn-dependent M28 family amino/carboxypeptidase